MKQASVAERIRKARAEFATLEPHQRFVEEDQYVRSELGELNAKEQREVVQLRPDWRTFYPESAWPEETDATPASSGAEARGGGPAAPAIHATKCEDQGETESVTLPNGRVVTIRARDSKLVHANMDAFAFVLGGLDDLGHARRLLAHIGELAEEYCRKRPFGVSERDFIFANMHPDATAQRILKAVLPDMYEGWVKACPKEVQGLDVPAAEPKLDDFAKRVAQARSDYAQIKKPFVSETDYVTAVLEAETEEDLKKIETALAGAGQGVRER